MNTEEVQLFDVSDSAKCFCHAVTQIKDYCRVQNEYGHVNKKILRNIVHAKVTVCIGVWTSIECHNT